MFIDVAQRIAADTGLDIVQQRNTITNILNHAAREMYKRLECNKVYWEVTLSVPANKIITLPSYIGELRGIRRCTSNIIVNQTGISDPRYNRQDWSYRWNNWRDMGESPVKNNPSLVGKLVISAGAVESTPVVVTVSGQTANALRIEETITMNGLSKQTVNLFGPQIYSLSCNSSERSCDITISDWNGVVLAVLYNTDRQTRYKVIDVSEAPQIVVTGTENDLIDVLYKAPLRTLSKDTDQFPAWEDYDDAWYWMSMYVYYMPLETKPDNFKDFMGNALAIMKASKENGEGQIEKRFSFDRCKYYNNTGSSVTYPWAITHIDNNTNNA